VPGSTAGCRRCRLYRLCRLRTGRLAPEELDERVIAALNARTAGDLRRGLADLPEPAAVLPEAGTPPPTVGRRGSRMLPLAAVALLGVLLMLGGGWPFLVFLQIVVVFGLIVGAAAIIAAAPAAETLLTAWPRVITYRAEQRQASLTAMGRL
jgi:Domain of unknown function (DUF1707)